MNSILHKTKFSYQASFRLSRFILQIIYIFLFLFSGKSTSAQDSSHIRISLLTCTPGEELYSTFGHTAIRVTDSIGLTDYVFNYGTFNFEDPSFYVKFVRGKLLYYLSAENFADFKLDYQADNRGITEQVLNLTAAEKTGLMHALYENSKPENREYQYDFFLDNCTTRARDKLMLFKQNEPAFKWIMPPGTTFRQAIHLYLDKNEKYWSKLGIDLLLGARTDGVMTISQSQFLPDNLMKSLDIENQHHQWVLSEANLYAIQPQDKNGNLFTPTVVFSLLLIVIALLSFSGNKKIKSFLHGFDGLFFFLTGLLGILFVFMWVGTDHYMTKNNYNLLWAWPFNVIAAFFVNTGKSGAKKYLLIYAIVLTILLLVWAFLPQQLNTALFPVVLLLIFRSLHKIFPAIIPS